MLRVYLDQNKWIDLARAATGHPRGAPFVDALAVCRAAAAAGTVSFPLDMYRYWETSKHGRDSSRNDVVDVMRELSRNHTVALPPKILDFELGRALRRRYGLAPTAQLPQVFGVGMQHIADDRLTWPILDLSGLPDHGASLPPGLRAQLEAGLSEVVEEGILRAGPQTFRDLGFPHSDSDHGERFVEFEESVAAAIARQGLTGDAIDVAVRATDFGDIRPAVMVALERLGLTYDEFMKDITVGDLMGFIDDLPTRFVTNVMRSGKHRQGQQPWQPNDLADVVALPVAAVYCDVVVTERQWVHHLRRGKVDERYRTRLLSSVADLTGVIIGHSTS